MLNLNYKGRKIEPAYFSRPHFKNKSKGPVLIGLEEIVQRQVGMGWVGRGGVGRGR